MKDMKTNPFFAYCSNTAPSFLSNFDHMEQTQGVVLCVQITYVSTLQLEQSI